MAIAEAFLAELEHEAPLTRESISRVPDDKLSYKPHEKSMPAANLIGHMGESLQWGGAILSMDVFDFDPETYVIPNPGTTQEAVDLFDKNLATMKELLGGTDDAKMMQTWKMSIKGETIMEMPRVAAFRGFVMNHMVHHRAQLGVYLRLNDLPVPSIYGPSADEGGM